MSGLKGVKTISVANGNAELFHVEDLRCVNLTIQKGAKLPNGVSIVDLLNEMKTQLNSLNTQVSTLEKKVNDLTIE